MLSQGELWPQLIGKLWGSLACTQGSYLLLKLTGKEVKIAVKRHWQLHSTWHNSIQSNLTSTRRHSCDRFFTTLPLPCIVLVRNLHYYSLHTGLQMGNSHLVSTRCHSCDRCSQAFPIFCHSSASVYYRSFLEAHLALREGTSCVKSRLCKCYLEWQLCLECSPHTFYWIVSGDNPHCLFRCQSIYRDMCHRNQMSQYTGFWLHQINEAADSRYVNFGLDPILTNLGPISLSCKLVRLQATQLDQFIQIVPSTF